MKGRLILATTLTLGVLLFFTLSIILIASFLTGFIGGPILLFLTVVFSILTWLISPWLIDLMHKWFYKFEFIEIEDLEERSPHTAKFLREACERNGIKIPMLRIVDDLNPTAYCYGSYPSNSRIVVSEGIFHYLTHEEVTAVYAHELGHIKNLDFILMTVANTLLMILYEIYIIFTRMRGRKNPLPIIGLVSLIFWWIGSYFVLYLSRTREYLADHFSGVETGDPNTLATALVKISYGIAAQPDTENTKRLLASTRSLGISDYKSADNVGRTVSLAAGMGDIESKIKSKKIIEFDPSRVSKVFLFDVYNPWAKVVQLGSTHPLTGLRIKALMNLCDEKGTGALFNFEEITLEGLKLDKGRLYGRFFFEVLIYFAPIVGLLFGLIFTAIVPPLFGIIFCTFGLGLFIKNIYRYPPISQPEDTTVFDLMCDPYASPLRGKPVTIQGTIIGKATAGSIFSEDLAIHDISGGLMTLNYESIIPFFGNLYFGYSTSKKIIGHKVNTTGWFRRKVYQIIDLKTLITEERDFKSYTRFKALALPFIMMIIGTILFLANIVILILAF